MRPNVAVCDCGAAHEVDCLSSAVLRHDLAVDAGRRAHVEHVNVDSIGACCDIGVSSLIAWMEVSYDAVLADIKISGFVGVLADSL